MRCLIAFVLATLLAGCSEQKSSARPAWTIERDWQAFPASTTSGAAETMWGGAHFRFKPDGTFLEYGGLQMAGRYAVSGDKVALSLDKMLGVDSYFMDAKMAPLKAVGGNELPKSVELRIDSGGNLILSKFGILTDKVVFRPAAPQSIEDEVRTIAHPPDDQGGSEGERLWDDIASRKKESVKPLIRLTRDPDRDVRWWAISFLGQTKDPRALKPLLDLCASADKRAVREAAEALGDLGDPRAVAPLLAAVRAKKVDEYTAGQALGKIGDKRAAAPLAAMLAGSKHPQYLLDGIGKLGDPSVLPELRKLETTKDPMVEISLAAAIAKLDPRDPYPKSKVPDLIKLSQSGDWMRQLDAVRALIAIRDPRAKSQYLRLLHDPTSTVRRDAIGALVDINAKDALPGIKPLLMDDDEQVRAAAQRAARILAR
ncbi:MAG TPA: HEAT repeat domain-containing protein [Fimbriimonadaceae bacterium]|nr:HEAT repeat domain-containing protein [Fimbriimonadaceae bacterium]